jgi:hypothetical protein
MVEIRNCGKPGYFIGSQNITRHLLKKDEFHVIYDKFVTFVKIFYQIDFNLKVLIKLKKIINTKQLLL